jgi:hypothetical protein
MLRKPFACFETAPKAASRRTHNVYGALLTMATLLTPSFAFACSCMRSPPETIRENAAIIIEGRVTNVQREGDQNGWVTARIEVTKPVKGSTPGTVNVTTRGNSAACGVNFTRGQTGEFLLTSQQGRYTTNLCLMMGARR